MEQQLEMSEYGIGVDPGWINLGAAVVKRAEAPFKFDILKARTVDPSLSDYPERNLFFLVDDLTEGLQISSCADPYVKDPTLCIERYVSYGNVRSSHTEEISTVIGMLRMQFWNWCGTTRVSMLKAIDWKIKLCQTLVKYDGFDNPSASLDKKFSLAAARHISTNPEKLKNDHEADAICLAAYPHVMAQAQATRASQRKPLG